MILELIDDALDLLVALRRQRDDDLVTRLLPYKIGRLGRAAQNGTARAVLRLLVTGETNDLVRRRSRGS